MLINRRHYRCYVNCNAKTRDTYPAVTFFCFPKKTDPKRKHAWVCNAGYENVGSRILNLVHERICSKHFSADSFTTPAKEKLKRTAVPIHYRTKSIIDSAKLMLDDNSKVAKEHESAEEFDDMIINDNPA